MYWQDMMLVGCSRPWHPRPKVRPALQGIRVRHIRVSLCHRIIESNTATRSVVSGSPKVPRKATALKRWMVVDRRWKRNAVPLISPVFRVRRLPRSLIKSIPLLLLGPRVSNATGTNWWLSQRWLYLVIFLVAANSAAAPPAVFVACEYYGATVSIKVAFHTRLRPPRHGINVSPSGLFLFVRELLLLLFLLLLLLHYYYYNYYNYYFYY